MKAQMFNIANRKKREKETFYKENEISNEFREQTYSS